MAYCIYLGMQESPWIGLKRLADFPYAWRWLHGEEPVYVNWNDSVSQSSDSCGLLDSTDMWHWKAFDCTALAPYICEKDATCKYAVLA